MISLKSLSISFLPYCVARAVKIKMISLPRDCIICSLKKLGGKRKEMIVSLNSS